MAGRGRDPMWICTLDVKVRFGFGGGGAGREGRRLISADPDPN